MLIAVALAMHLGAAAQAQEWPDDAANAPAYDLQAAYTTEFWRNVRGGLRKGGVHLDNFDLTLAIDGERAWGVPGLSTFVYALYNDDASFSQRYVGDSMTVSNIDAPHAARLYEAWVEWSGSKASVRVGLYDLNSEFDMSESRSLFIHSAHGVGHDLGQSGENGPSIFPVTSLGLRVAWQFSPSWRILAAVLDGVPGDRDDPERSGIHLSSEEGSLGVTEVQWSAGRITKLSLGHWRYTADFADLRSSAEIALPERDDNRGTYAAVEVTLDRDPVSEPATLAFLRYGVANSRINECDEYLGVGIRRKGPLSARPQDELGLAVSWAGLSAAARTADAPRKSYEAAIELTYRMPINEWLALQPDVQFIVHPSADLLLSDSIAFGLRFEVSLAASR